MNSNDFSINLEKILAILFLIYGVIVITEAFSYPEPGPLDKWHLFYFPFPTFEDFGLYLYISILLGLVFVALYGFFFLTKGPEFFQKKTGENIFEKIFFYFASEGFWAIEALVAFYVATLFSSFFVDFVILRDPQKHVLERIISIYLSAGLFFLLFGFYKLLPSKLQFIGVVRDVVLSKKGPAIVRGPTKKQSLLAIISLFLFCVLGFFLFTEKIVLTTNSKEICGTITDLDRKDSCYSQLADKTGDFSTCYLIEDIDTKSECFLWIAERTKNQSVCQNIDPDYTSATYEYPPRSLRDYCLDSSKINRKG